MKLQNLIACRNPSVMRYEDFRNTIQRELRRRPRGLTWVQLRDELELPYERPCPTWTRRLEKEIRLSRVKLPGKAALIWRVVRGR